MAQLIFKYTDEIADEENREINEVTLKIPNDMSITEYKAVCMRLASVLGYNPISIKRGFADYKEVVGDIDDLRLAMKRETDNGNKK